MIKTIIKKLRAEYKKEYIKRYALQRNVHKIKVLKKVERKIKNDLGVYPDVVYVDVKYKPLFDRKGVNGCYGKANNIIIVYITNEFKKNLRTLCHEIVHAHQYHYNTKQYLSSVRAYRSGKVSYKNAWHEVDAREKAQNMVNGYYALACKISAQLSAEAAAA